MKIAHDKSQKEQVLFLEQGDIYFFYRPRVQTKEVHNPETIQRLYFVLKGEQSSYYRLIIVGKKQLPSYSESQVEFAFNHNIRKSL